jgi:hypothetical protein
VDLCLQVSGRSHLSVGPLDMSLPSPQDKDSVPDTLYFLVRLRDDGQWILGVTIDITIWIPLDGADWTEDVLDGLLKCFLIFRCRL